MVLFSFRPLTLICILRNSFRSWERHFLIALLWPHPESRPNAPRVSHSRCATISAAIRSAGAPKSLNRPWTMTKLPSHMMILASYLSVEECSLPDQTTLTTGSNVSAMLNALRGPESPRCFVVTLVEKLVESPEHQCFVLLFEFFSHCCLLLSLTIGV